MNRQQKKTIFFASLLVAFGMSTPFLFRKAMTSILDRHKTSVKASLAEWADQYSIITNTTTMTNAIEMLGYIQIYYTTGPGYRGSENLEKEIEHQRSLTLQKIASALEKYTGQANGTNAQLWKQWLNSQTNIQVQN